MLKNSVFLAYILHRICFHEHDHHGIMFRGQNKSNPITDCARSVMLPICYHSRIKAAI